MSHNQISRTFNILKLLTEEPGLTCTEMSRKCPEIAIATLARLLKTLIKEKILLKDREARYFLGSTTIDFASAAVNAASAGKLLRPVVKDLAEETRHTAVYFELIGDSVKLAAAKQWPGSAKCAEHGHLDTRIFTHPAATTIIAFSDESLADFLIKNKHLSQAQSNKFHERLNDIRQNGCFCGEDPDLTETKIMYPVYCKEKVNGCIGVCLPETNIEPHIIEDYRIIVEHLAKAACKQLTLVN